KVVLVFLFCIFPILINTYQGVKNTDSRLVEVARSFCSKEWRLWRDLILPSSAPFILAGIRLAIGRGLIGMVVAEFYTTITGLGYMIVQYANSFRMVRFFVPVVVFMVVQEVGIIVKYAIEAKIMTFEGVPAALRAMIGGGGQINVAAPCIPPFVASLAQGSQLKAIGTYAVRHPVAMVAQAEIQRCE